MCGGGVGGAGLMASVGMALSLRLSPLRARRCGALQAKVDITSRFEGRIMKLHYAVGDMAATGKPLVDIEVADAAGAAAAPAAAGAAAPAARAAAAGGAAPRSAVAAAPAAAALAPEGSARVRAHGGGRRAPQPVAPNLTRCCVLLFLFLLLALLHAAGARDASGAAHCA